MGSQAAQCPDFSPLPLCPGGLLTGERMKVSGGVSCLPQSSEMWGPKPQPLAGARVTGLLTSCPSQDPRARGTSETTSVNPFMPRGGDGGRQRNEGTGHSPRAHWGPQGPGPPAPDKQALPGRLPSPSRPQASFVLAPWGSISLHGSQGTTDPIPAGAPGW